MRRRYHVRQAGDKWTVTEQSDLQAFWYDLTHHGLYVALYNLWYLVARA